LSKDFAIADHVVNHCIFIRGVCPVFDGFPEAQVPPPRRKRKGARRKNLTMKKIPNPKF
jgi:hypothetical protein